MKTIKFNNLVNKEGNTIEIEVPDDYKQNEAIKEQARLAASRIKKVFEGCVEASR